MLYKGGGVPGRGSEDFNSFIKAEQKVVKGNNPHTVDMIGGILRELMSSQNPGEDIRAILRAMPEITQPIDNVLSMTNAVPSVLSILDTAYANADLGVSIAALSLLQSWLALSPFPGPIIAENNERIVKLIEVNELVCFVVGIIQQLLRANPDYVKVLVVDMNLLSKAVEMIHTERYTPQAVGELFELMTSIIKNTKKSVMETKIGDVALCDIPKNIVQTYVSASYPDVILHSLHCLDALVHRWPRDYSELITDPVLDKLVWMTTNMRSIDPFHVGAVLESVLDIWHVWVLHFIENTRVIETIVPALADLLSDFPNQSTRILALFSNIAYHAHTGINLPVYQMIMKNFDSVSFNNKEMLMMIFCNLAVHHADDIIELGNYEQLLNSAFDCVDMDCSKKLTLAFLKSIYALFSADNDLIDGDSPVIDPEALRELVENCIHQSTDHELFRTAQLLKDHFMSEKVEPKDLLFAV